MTAATAPPQQKKEPIWLKFVNSGLSGMGATCCVQPIDLIKTRMQLAGEAGGAKYRSSLHAAMDIIKTDGLLRMYNGYVFLLSLLPLIPPTALLVF